MSLLFSVLVVVVLVVVLVVVVFFDFNSCGAFFVFIIYLINDEAFCVKAVLAKLERWAIA